MNKDTSELLKALESHASFKAFYNENSESLVKKELSEYLGELLLKKGIKKSEAIKRSELNEIYGYQIFAGSRVPERKKLICLCVGMGLSLSETQTLLKSAGYAPLYPKNEYDCVIIFGICNNFSVSEINNLLFDYDLEVLV